MKSAYEIVGNKIKVKYESLDWNQREPYLDVFDDIEKVKAYCGKFGEDIEGTTCWLDAYNWSLMNKTPLTEDIYQFISHRAGIIRGGFDKEIASWEGFNWEMFYPMKEQVLGQLKKGVINLIDFML